MSNSMNSTTGIPGSRLVEHIIPRSFTPGYVVLSFLVSFVGAWTTLELLNRRTKMSGSYNWFLLTASSLTMGGIAIWSMHFIGDRAIILGDGRPQLQIVYSGGFTFISFILPVVVVFFAFSALGSYDTMNVTRVVLGGALAGFGICGMHYVGQAGIANYDCVYPIPFVIAAFVIAVVASIVALSIFFQFRLQWDTTWWKRPLVGIPLATAVSGQHWLASIGTQYQLRKVEHSRWGMFSEQVIVIAVMVLSISGCIILSGTALLVQRRMKKLAKRAQQVVLAAAIFDNEDKILVTIEGYLPNKKITDSWVERSLDDAFNVSHPVFLWMFRATRCWKGVVDLLPGMRHEVHRAKYKRHLGSKFEQSLVNSHGSPIEDYTVVFRELFCIAAGDLANDLHQSLDKIGVLYEEITPTGGGPMKNFSAKDLDIEGLGGGKGQLLFLVRSVNRREAERLQAAGYRFATPSAVMPILTKTLQVKPESLTRLIEAMREFAADDHMLDPGLHVALFAVRAAVGAGRHGFDILARKDAKNQLPTMQLPFDTLEDWHIDYLRTMDSMTMVAIMKVLNKARQPSNPSQKEQKFAKDLLQTIEALKEESSDPIFNEAMLIADPIKAPCRGISEDSPPGLATLITFRMIVPIQVRAPGRKLIYTPLSFFKLQQLVYKNSRDHDIFTRQMHREFAFTLEPNVSSNIGSVRYNVTFAFGIFGNDRRKEEQDQPGSRKNTLAPPAIQLPFSRAKTRAKTCARGKDTSEANLVDTNSHDDDQAQPEVGNSGGRIDAGSRQTTGISPRNTHGQVLGKPAAELTQEAVEDKPTYIDEMFRITIAKR